MEKVQKPGKRNQRNTTTKENTEQNLLGKAPVEVEEREFQLPSDILESELTNQRNRRMENGEAMREMGREMSRALAEGIAAALAAQNETIQQSLATSHRNAEDTREAFRDLVHDQGRNHREDMETLAEQFQRLQATQTAAQEIARTQFTQKLPNYDGLALTFDDW